MGELHGHISSVTHIALDERLNHVFTLSIDKTIKVWDLRNHKCLQTISEDDWANASDSQATSMIYDNSRRRLVTAFHRPYVWQHKAITQDRTGHREPIRGALYNSLFAVVVSVDDGGATCVWNLQDGGRTGRFTGGHSNSKVTAVSFDRNQRRLVTAANDGSIKMWNFNNGSLLRRFCHDLQPLEMCDVLLTQDEKRGGDNLYAAGWNAKVFMWEDEDEAVVENFKAFDGHEGDILAMAAYPDRQLLATGDCTGRVIVWGLGSGERKSTLWYSCQQTMCYASPALRAEQHNESTVQRLLWLPAFSPEQREAAAETAALAAAALRHGGSSGAGLAVPAELQVHQQTAQQQPNRHGQQLHSVGKAESDGSGIPLMVVPSQVSVTSNLLSSDLSSQQHMLPHQHESHHKCPFPSRSSYCQGTTAANPSCHSAELSETAGRTTGSDNDDNESDEDDAVLGKQKEAPDALLLLVAGGDGLVQVWRIGQLAQATLLCSLPGAQGMFDVVSALAVDEELTVVVMGDSSGHLRTFDISRGIDTSSSEAARASFVERAHWQAHEESLSSVSITPARPIAGTSQSGGTTASCSAVSGSGGAGQGRASAAGVRRSEAGSTGGAKLSCCGCHCGMVPPLIVAGSRDTHVTVWTLDGGLVGTFGEHSWDLDNVTTWQDPQGLKQRPPKAVDDGLFLKSVDDRKGRSSAGSSGTAPATTRASSTARRSAGSFNQPKVSFSSATAAAASSSTNRSSGVSLSMSKAASAYSRKVSGNAAEAPSTTAGVAGNAAVKLSEFSIGVLKAHEAQNRANGSDGHKSYTPAGAYHAQQQQPEVQLSDLHGLSLASIIIQDHKAKARHALMSKPEQPYCQLAVHELEDVEGTASEVLHAADRRHGKGRHLTKSNSNNSQHSSWSGVSHYSRPPGFNWRQR